MTKFRFRQHLDGLVSSIIVAFSIQTEELVEISLLFLVSLFVSFVFLLFLFSDLILANKVDVVPWD